MKWKAIPVAIHKPSVLDLALVVSLDDKRETITLEEATTSINRIVVRWSELSEQLSDLLSAQRDIALGIVVTKLLEEIKTTDTRLLDVYNQRRIVFHLGDVKLDSNWHTEITRYFGLYKMGVILRADECISGAAWVMSSKELDCPMARFKEDSLRDRDLLLPESWSPTGDESTQHPPGNESRQDGETEEQNVAEKPHGVIGKPSEVEFLAEPPAEFPAEFKIVNSVYATSVHKIQGDMIPKAIVVHATGEEFSEGLLEKFLNDSSFPGTHFLILKDGRILQLAPVTKRLRHAGISYCCGKRNWDRFSVAVTLEHLNQRGDSYTERQLRSLRKLVQALVKRYRIPHQLVVGHKEVAGFRGKSDPFRLDVRKVVFGDTSLWEADMALYHIRNAALRMSRAAGRADLEQWVKEHWALPREVPER